MVLNHDMFYGSIFYYEVLINAFHNLDLLVDHDFLVTFNILKNGFSCFHEGIHSLFHQTIISIINSFRTEELVYNYINSSNDSLIYNDLELISHFDNLKHVLNSNYYYLELVKYTYHA